MATYDVNVTPVSGKGRDVVTPIGNNPKHEDPDNHYYIHPNDNTTTGAITPLLDSGNYHTWHTSFLIQLSLRNKLGFIYGTLKQPSLDDPDLRLWLKCNTLILSWMMHFVSHEIKNTILFVETAKEAWEILKIRYSEPTEVRAYQLELELNMVT